MKIFVFCGLILFLLATAVVVRFLTTYLIFDSKKAPDYWLHVLVYIMFLGAVIQNVLAQIYFVLRF